MSRRVGRPRKKYLGDEPTPLTIVVPRAIRETIPHTANISKEVSLYLSLKYGSKNADEEELKELRSRINELEIEMSALRAKEELIIDRMKRKDEEMRELIFERDAVAYFLINRSRNLVRSGTPYDVDYEVQELRENWGISISREGFIRLIRNAGDASPSPEFFGEYGVALLPGCQSKKWFPGILEDFRKHKEAIN
jgi:predicted transcriptional regulator